MWIPVKGEGRIALEQAPHQTVCTFFAQLLVPAPPQVATKVRSSLAILHHEARNHTSNKLPGTEPMPRSAGCCKKTSHSAEANRPLFFSLRLRPPKGLCGRGQPSATTGITLRADTLRESRARHKGPSLGVTVHGTPRATDLFQVLSISGP